ncbi:MAG: RluA family pseudouridine synthase [Endomicrobium sp.]|jgi:23S rRNA pseudouridine1911/1915/1917 synthase|nr:RluA family pseudouridine synthase [Endomicrobium sp.]
MEEKVVYKKFEKKRLDFYLASIYKDYSRSYFQKLMYKKKILVNNKISFSSYKLKYGDVIIFEFEEGKSLSIRPENIKFNIIYEDIDIIVVNKPAGIVVHPSYGHSSGTLLNALIRYSNGNYKLPYLVHRLDKDTSGVIIFAKNEKAKVDISKQFKNRNVKKIYYAAVKGIIIENRGKIEAPLGRSPQNRKLMTVNSLAKKMAITEFKTVLRCDGYTLLEVKIITGRTHQIRSHMKYINHPVVGDQQYGGPKTINGKQFNRQMLHSYNISFMHPRTMKIMKFTAELPNEMKMMLI